MEALSSRTTVTPAWLRARSPRKGLLSASPVMLLDSLYTMGEHVAIYTRLGGKPHLWTNLHMEADMNALDAFRRGHDGVWFGVHPIDYDGQITARRYALLESGPFDPWLWLGTLVRQPWLIVAIFSDGDAGVQALVEDDSGSQQLARLPQCWRRDTGRLQELMFLNPNPTGEPICDL